MNATEALLRSEKRFGKAVKAIVLLGERRTRLQMQVRSFWPSKREGINYRELFLRTNILALDYEPVLVGALVILKSLDADLGGCDHDKCRKLRAFRDDQSHSSQRGPITAVSSRIFVEGILLEVGYHLEDEEERKPLAKREHLEEHLNDWIKCLNLRMRRRRDSVRLSESVPDWLRRSVESLQDENVEIPTIQTNEELVDSGRRLANLQHGTIGWGISIEGTQPTKVSIRIPRREAILPSRPTQRSVNRSVRASGTLSPSLPIAAS